MPHALTSDCVHTAGGGAAASAAGGGAAAAAAAAAGVAPGTPGFGACTAAAAAAAAQYVGFTEMMMLRVAAKQGLNVLFCMPNVTHCVLLVSVTFGHGPMSMPPRARIALDGSG
jgi:hypothetical protein